VDAGALPGINIWVLDGGAGPNGPTVISPDTGGDVDDVSGVVRLRAAF
jgi:hypothetical protein